MRQRRTGMSTTNSATRVPMWRRGAQKCAPYTYRRPTWSVRQLDHSQYCGLILNSD